MNEPKIKKRNQPSIHFAKEIAEPSFAWKHQGLPAQSPLREGEQSRLSTIDKVTDHSFNSHLESIPRDQSRASFIPPSPIKGSSSLGTLAKIDLQSRNGSHNRSQPLKQVPYVQGSNFQSLQQSSLHRKINHKIGLYDPVQVKRGFDNIGLSKVSGLHRHASDRQMSEKELSRFSFGPVNESQTIQNKSISNAKTPALQNNLEEYPFQRTKLFKIHLMPCPAKANMKEHSGTMRAPLPQKYGGLDKQRQRLEGLIANLRGQLKFYEREAQRIDHQYKRESRPQQR